MLEHNDATVKILFKFYSNVLEEWTVETMWATIIDIDKGFYKLDNIPFYAPLIASDDIVFAEYDETELMLTYRETIEYSGNSTIQVIIMDDVTEINSIRDIFKNLGCTSERANDKYFVMEIPADIDYIPVRKKLMELEEKGILGFAEPCLSEKHKY